MLHHTRPAVRSLVREPVSSMALVATLALGIGANAAVFMAADATILRRLPFPEADRLVRIVGPTPQSFVRLSISGFELWPPELNDERVFTAIGVFATGGLNLGGEPAIRVRAAAVSSGFFDVLSVAPLLGRTFQGPEEAPTLAVLSHRLWERQFGADPSVIGRSVLLNARPFTITGVMPPGIDYPGGSEVWIPAGGDRQIASNGVLDIVARLRAGVDVRQAALLADRFDQRTGIPGPGLPRVRVVPLKEDLTRDAWAVLALVAAASLMALLVACINVASLLLARLAAREREFAVRRALGASRLQTVAQVLWESLVLSGAAAVAAVPTAAVLMRILREIVPPALQDAFLRPFTARSLLATALIALATTLLFGLGPALSVASREPAHALQAPVATTGRFWRQTRSGLVLAQLSAAVMLLVSSATIARTVTRLQQVDLGVDPHNLLTAELTLPVATFGRDDTRGARLHAFYERLDAALRLLPGVQEVGAADVLPAVRLGTPVPALHVAVEGRPGPGPGQERVAIHACATAGYFTALGIPLVAGRSFRGKDLEEGRVAMVSERFAQAVGLSPGQIVGRRANVNDSAGGTPIWSEVVGVVRDVRFSGPESSPQAALYQPCVQKPAFGSLFVAVKCAADPGAFGLALRRVSERVDPSVPLYNTRTFDEIHREYLADRRFIMAVMIVFSTLTFVVGAIGLYGLIAYVVQTRQREFGIRLAVGCSPAGIRSQVLRSGLVHAASGVVLGLAGIVALWRVGPARLVRLGGIEATDGLLVAGGVLAVALVASWLPARQATKLDPAAILRSE
jgi:putative ABC transport system permease protein